MTRFIPFGSYRRLGWVNRRLAYNDVRTREHQQVADHRKRGNRGDQPRPGVRG